MSYLIWCCYVDVIDAICNLKKDNFWHLKKKTIFGKTLTGFQMAIFRGVRTGYIYRVCVTQSFHTKVPLYLSGLRLRVGSLLSSGDSAFSDLESLGELTGKNKF